MPHNPLTDDNRKAWVERDPELKSRFERSGLSLDAYVERNRRDIDNVVFGHLRIVPYSPPFDAPDW